MGEDSEALAKDLRAAAEAMRLEREEQKEMGRRLIAATVAVEQLAQEMRNKSSRRAASGSTKVRRQPTRKVEVSPRAEAIAKAAVDRIRAKH